MITQQINKWKKAPNGPLFHCYNVLLARGKYLTDPKEMARLKRIEARVLKAQA